jgi:predicted  nucleic acid-binding Zn-ribbon protein
VLNLKKRFAAAIEWRVDVRLDGIRHELDGVRRELHEVREATGDFRRDFDRLIPQIAALETRLADLDERGLTAGDQERLDLARENERIRIKLQAISHYEERLRRLESALGALEAR